MRRQHISDAGEAQRYSRVQRATSLGPSGWCWEGLGVALRMAAGRMAGLTLRDTSLHRFIDALRWRKRNEMLDRECRDMVKR